MTSSKPVVLHLGDPVKYNLDLYERFASQFTIIRPSEEERQRDAFMAALKEKRWGDFDAIFRPFWNSGGEMGRWDRELVPLLPKSVKVFARILYCNGATASSEAVADTAIFHILAVFRNFTWSQQAARSGDPEQWLDAHRNTALTAWNPRGRALGIIGLGNIGYTIAQKAYRGFGMKIFYHDLVRKSEEQEKAVEATFCPSKEDLVSRVDCVVLATPFGGKVLVDAELLKHFRSGSRFVNIARGKLVDEEALVAALESGHLLAAGLDVQANEPHVHPKMPQMRNVALTCHNAGGAMDTRIGFEWLAMENVLRVLTGQEALTPVNKHLFPK
ncbi:D-mandelate dehydrogenase [Rasamsonia emersonii CBS 393.64]|uniref:D-mandelate dehydrogenase n=1 Tax=Rasamsonia emersonii (strain ATCC 16479 / CBS 393.64 / IMI 116815) TaxID=1408163 RepID=A0A0F4YSW5_RASE3|nr:D-mandelate dehydrogenase [Rasamsonia emersonii CBS 393.64]KKA20713.1 D-mandelate dehydrogenase [Rasamsonia emersonii CBS 393.64]